MKLVEKVYEEVYGMYVDESNYVIQNEFAEGEPCREVYKWRMK